MKSALANFQTLPLKDVVRCLVEMLAPYKGRICDPACGSGGIAFTFTTFVSTDPQPKQIAAWREKGQQL